MILWFILSAVVGGAILFHTGYRVGRASSKDVDPSPDCNSNALWESAYSVVEASLLENPEDWVSDGYDLKNVRAGMSIWIANSDYGLSVSMSGKKKETFGTSGTSHSPSAATRKRLWEAVNTRIAAEVVNRFRTVEESRETRLSSK